MGLTEEEQKKSQELRLQANGGGTNMERSSTKEETAPTGEIITSACGSQAEGNGCCRANGTSSPCCQSPLLPEKAAGNHPPAFLDEATKYTVEKKKKKKSNKKQKQISRKNSGKGGCRKVCTMPTWFESWEREDTYAVLAVIGAAASVAVAYSCYKQLR